MKSNRLRFPYPAITSLFLTTSFYSCKRRGGKTKNGEQPGKLAGKEVLSVEDIQAIAQETFLHGLPIVMNYAVMQEYAMDTNSGQFKALSTTF